MSKPVTKEQITALLMTVKAVADVIKELGTVPSGVLYSQLMGHMTLENYQWVIAKLKGAGLITEANNVLTWVAK